MGEIRLEAICEGKRQRFCRWPADRRCRYGDPDRAAATSTWLCALTGKEGRDPAAESRNADGRPVNALTTGARPPSCRLQPTFFERVTLDLGS